MPVNPLEFQQSHKIPSGSKVIPLQAPPSKSIVTVRLDSPKQLEVIPNKFDANKLRAHIYDNDGTKYAWLGISDLGFYHAATKNAPGGDLIERINKSIASQDSLYVRVGLSRTHKQGDREGYWLQVNGIYTFPNFLGELRKYP